MPVGDEVRRLLGEREVGVGQAEGSDLAVDERVAFGGAPADPVVLAQHNPVVLSGQRNPLAVFNVLGGKLAVDVG